MTKFDTDLVRAIRAATLSGEDIIQAGEVVARKLAAPKLKVSPRPDPNQPQPQPQPLPQPLPQP